MREISVSAVTDVVERLCIEANTHLPGDVKCAIETCRACEDSSFAQSVLDKIIENYRIADSENVPICQESYVRGMADRGMVMWANSIVYDHNAVLTAGHTDDIAVSVDPDYGWGWLVNRGFNIIQTDWPLALKTYLKR